MKLSIIIVSYNEKEYISEAIESCMSQEGKFDYEIIIGDDGSNDGSLEIIERYQEQYLVHNNFATLPLFSRTVLYE